MGVDTLELDVGVTRDGVVVIHHDRRLNPDVARRRRTVGERAGADHPLAQFFGNASFMTWAASGPGSEYAARFPHQKPIDGTRIPRLADLLAKMRDSKVRFNIETKLVPQAPRRDAAAGAFRARGDRRGAQGRAGGAHHHPVVRFPHPEGGRARGAGNRHRVPDLGQELRSGEGPRGRRARLVAEFPRPRRRKRWRRRASSACASSPGR